MIIQRNFESYQRKAHEDTIQTDYLEERFTIIHRNCSKVFPIQSNTRKKIKHEDKNCKISRYRFNQDILKDKKEIANTIYFSKLGLYKGETEKVELPDCF